MQATNKVADNLSTNNLMIVLLLLTLIIIGASGLVAKTLITGLIRDTKVLSAENKANKALDENLEAAPQLISSYQSLGPTSRVLADALPNDSNFPGLIVALENIAADASVTLKSVAPAQVLAVDAPAAGGQAAGGLAADAPAVGGQAADAPVADILLLTLSRRIARNGWIQRRNERQHLSSRRH